MRSLRQRRAPYRPRTQRSDSIEQLEPVTDCSDAELLQDLVRQARQDRLVNLILAECRLVFPEAQAPQPDRNVHRGAHKSAVTHIISGGREGVQR